MRALFETSRLHIVSIGALGTLTFGWLLFGQHWIWLAVVSAFDWFLVNWLNRVVDFEEDRSNGIAGTDFVVRHKRAMVWLGFSALSASVLLTWQLASELLPYRLAFHALGMAYNYPLLPGKRRIKQLYFWKNNASAMGFLLTVFALPMAHGYSLALPLRIPLVGVVFIAAFFVLFELSYEVLYDLRDEHGDRMAHVRSYPVVHGRRAAERIVDGLVATSATCLMAGYFARVVPWRAMVMVAAPVGQFVYYTVNARRVRRIDPSLPIVTAKDCIRLTWIGALMLALYNVWVLLRLPGV